MRLRPHSPPCRRSLEEIKCFLGALAGELNVSLSEKTGSVLITYNPSEELQNALLAQVCLLPEEEAVGQSGGGICHSPTLRESISVEVKQQAATEARNPIFGKILSFVFPSLVKSVMAVFRAIPYFLRGLGDLAHGRLSLNTLDAAALLVCLLRRDFRSLSSITFFFSLGAFLESWTRRKSHGSLAESLALNITHAWVKQGDMEAEIPLENLRPGDIVVVRAGSVLPVDGTVVWGEAMVNQASMTGEPLAVRCTVKADVYAGTFLEEGELHISATKVSGETRIDSILHYIEESEYVKAGIQSKFERLADGIVPYNFLLALLVYAITRDAMRAGSVLLVDYSCAIRLATPLKILSSMSEAARHGILIKGGRFFEALAEADAIIFDKTGTLTEARPKVAEIIPFGNHDADAVLRLAACLEEHFPHPIGQAVVYASEQKNLRHLEEHAKVEFIVAHGIATKLHGERVLIGSEHFVVEDSGLELTPEQKEAARRQTGQGRSVLYLAVAETLAGIIAIEDKMRPGMPQLIAALRGDGFKRIIMLTGDSHLTAEAVARQAGIQEFKARLLPEQKAQFVARLQAEGATVLMLGDGINDAPALAAANAGVALTHGADMAKEVADIVLTHGNPADILPARMLARQTLARIRKNFHISLALNSLFLAGGLSGILSPGLSAFLHNASTATLAVHSMTPLLPEPFAEPEEEMQT